MEVRPRPTTFPQYINGVGKLAGRLLILLDLDRLLNKGEQSMLSGM